jgi:hypothetical protein
VAVRILAVTVALCVPPPVVVRFTVALGPLTAALIANAPEFANRLICPLVVVSVDPTVSDVPLDR